MESSPSRKKKDIAELAIGYGLILLVLWTPPPWQRRIYLVAAGFLILASIRPGETWRGLGLSSRHLLRSGTIPVVAVALAIASMLAAQHLHVLHAPNNLRGLIGRFWGYAIWSFAQQFLLLDFFLLRFRRLLPGRMTFAVTCAAGIFAFAHLPNPALTLFTAIWGVVACVAFLRYRNLYTLGLAHAILGITVAVCLPGSVTHNMHVGLGYLRYGHHDHRKTSDHTVSTKV